jgi:hypothetical protein
MISNSNRPSNFVRASNNLSCSVACVLSICYDNGLLKKEVETDEQVINNHCFFQYFPHWNPDHWEFLPGVLNDTDIIKLAELLNLVPNNKTIVITEVAEEHVKVKFAANTTIGILILTQIDYSCNPWQHCFKLVDIVENDYYLLDPSTPNVNQITKFKWKDISTFKSSCITFE